MTFEGEALRFRHEGPTLVVTLHRTPCNEIGSTALRELEVLAAYLRNGASGARAMVMHSSIAAGFCAGADLRELHEGLVSRQQASGERVEQLGAHLGAAGHALLGRAAGRVGRVAVRWEISRFIRRIHRVFDTLDRAPIPTVAALHGVVFGGGFELALTSDVIVADKTARFCFPELRLGLVPGFGGIPRLNRDLPNALVRDLLLTGRSVGAKRAHAAGLVSQLVARGKHLDVAMRVAEQAARFDQRTVAEAKAFLKPHPKRELARERRTFTRMVTRPAVLNALQRFVTSDDLRPYLP
jgi:enoyl-CoA hydratase/carnithine racemase